MKTFLKNLGLSSRPTEDSGQAKAHKFAYRAKSSNRGFSLIELLVVIGIIGILAAVAIPSYNSYKADAVEKTLHASMQTIARAFSVCFSIRGLSSCNTLVGIKVSIPNGFTAPDITSVPTNGTSTGGVCFSVIQGDDATVEPEEQVGCALVSNVGDIVKITVKKASICTPVRTGTPNPTGCL